MLKPEVIRPDVKVILVISFYVENVLKVYILPKHTKTTKLFFTKLSKLTFFSFRISYNFTEYCFCKKYK